MASSGKSTQWQLLWGHSQLYSLTFRSTRTRINRAPVSFALGIVIPKHGEETSCNFGVENVEVLDFCGPFEVFSVTRLNEERRRDEPSPFNVFLVAEAKGPVATTGGMKCCQTTASMTAHTWISLLFQAVGVRAAR